MPANIERSGLEVSLVNVMSREKILKQYIDSVKQLLSWLIATSNVKTSYLASVHLPIS